jgi:anhydro-N-acetylmuramic acid kinase
MKNSYNVIGIMSGTSLDGVDVAHCRFVRKKKEWKAEIISSKTFGYNTEWQGALSNAHQLSGEKLIHLHTHYGKFLGQLIKSFIKKESIKKVDLVASHGHTIFHQPALGFTFQLGDGNAIHAKTKIPVAYDFRSLDVALGGQGAPLVPIGDALLFSKYDLCLNLGGIGNISVKEKSKITAFDFCYCNMALNYLTSKIEKNFDNKGKMSQQGIVNKNLLAQIEKIYFSNKKQRPSLGREGFEKDLQPLLDDESIPLNDRLHTVCESIAHELSLTIPDKKRKQKLLITGGGAFNNFLIHKIEEKLKGKVKVVVPEKKIIAFKEALVFAFLGVLRLRGEINALKSVTNASHDSCSGTLIGI